MGNHRLGEGRGNSSLGRGLSNAGRLTRGQEARGICLLSPGILGAKPRCLQVLTGLPTPKQDTCGLGAGQGLATCGPGGAG